MEKHVIILTSWSENGKQQTNIIINRAQKAKRMKGEREGGGRENHRYGHSSIFAMFGNRRPHVYDMS